jgi:hypothetical protein
MIPSSLALLVRLRVVGGNSWRCLDRPAVIGMPFLRQILRLHRRGKRLCGSGRKSGCGRSRYDYSNIGLPCGPHAVMAANLGGRFSRPPHHVR